MSHGPIARDTRSALPLRTVSALSYASLWQKFNLIAIVHVNVKNNSQPHTNLTKDFCQSYCCPSPEIQPVHINWIPLSYVLHVFTKTDTIHMSPTTAVTALYSSEITFWQANHAVETNSSASTVHAMITTTVRRQWLLSSPYITLLVHYAVTEDANRALGSVWPCSVPAIPSWWLWLICSACSGDLRALSRVESGCRVISFNSTRRKSTGQTRWDSWVGLGLYSLKSLHFTCTTTQLNCSNSISTLYRRRS